ncbi:MAG: hypothetical protein GY953_43450, partial [bacterium]|nr:hypothetical protein [bacterium]
VQRFLPHYVEGVAAAQVMLWSIFFVTLHATVSPFLVAAGQVSRVLKLSAVVSLVGLGMLCLVIEMGFGLVGAAWTVVAVMACVATGELWFARLVCGHKGREIVTFLATLYLPLAGALALGALAGALAGAGGVDGLARSSAQVLVYLALYAPLLAAYESRFSLLRTVYQVR